MEFAANPVAAGFLQRSGSPALPLILVDGQVALAGRYPSREEIAHWCGLAGKPTLPVLTNDCCGGGGTC